MLAGLTYCSVQNIGIPASDFLKLYNKDRFGLWEVPIQKIQHSFLHRVVATCGEHIKNGSTKATKGIQCICDPTAQ